MWANILLLLVLELEVRVEEHSVRSSSLPLVFISLLSEYVARIFLPSERLMVV